MTYILTCLLIALYYIRPFEIFESIRGMPVLLILGVIAVIFLLMDIAAGKVKLFNNGTDQMMVGFFLAIGISHISHLYFGGANKSMQDFLPVFIGYFLIAHSVTSATKLKVFIYVLILCTAFLAYEGILEARNGISSFGVEPLLQHVGEDGGGKSIYLTRIKWVGTFEDPNDLAMIFVMVVPFLLNMVLDKKYLIPSMLLGMICYAVILTKSRGGIVALVVSVCAVLSLRYRTMKGLVVIGPIAALLLVTSGTISSSEESAYGRIDAWYEGFQMFKSAPLFGVGKGFFTDNHELTAHNSLMLVVSELGLFGSLFFVGMFYFPIMSAYKSVIGRRRDSGNQDVFNVYTAIWSSLLGAMASMFFLSRAYVLVPYMMIALSMSFVNYEYREYEFVNTYNNNMAYNIRRIGISTIGVVAIIYVIVKILI